MEQDIPVDIQVELNALEEQLDHTIPAKQVDRNVLIATWNLRAFGDLTRKWASDEEDTPRRDMHALQIITRIIRRFDVIAIQEVKSNIRALRDMLKLLGDNWSFTLTDVTEGSAGNGERMAFVFDTRRVKLSGLAGELVVPKERLDSIEEGALRDQFARTPYAVSFRSEHMTFILVTLHILYGKSAKDRVSELKAIADWMSDWASDINAYDQNLIALGDFNVEERGDILHQTFISSGLFIPKDLAEVTRSIFNAEKFYDHIAWFIGRRGVSELTMQYIKGGNFDFVPHVFRSRGLSKNQISWMISDHYPLWTEFSIRK